MPEWVLCSDDLGVVSYMPTERSVAVLSGAIVESREVTHVLYIDRAPAAILVTRVRSKRHPAPECSTRGLPLASIEWGLRFARLQRLEQRLSDEYDWPDRRYQAQDRDAPGFW